MANAITGARSQAYLSKANLGPGRMLTIENFLKKDDLIVIAGAGGFIGGSLVRYYHEMGYARIRAVDKKPLPNWFQRVPGVECLSLELSELDNAARAVEG